MYTCIYCGEEIQPDWWGNKPTLWLHVRTKQCACDTTATPSQEDKNRLKVERARKTREKNRLKVEEEKALFEELKVKYG